MDPKELPDFEPHRPELGMMPGANGNEMAPPLRSLTHADTTRRGMLWSSIGVGLLVVGTGIWFLGDWLHWF